MVTLAAISLGGLTCGSAGAYSRGEVGRPAGRVGVAGVSRVVVL